MTSSPETHQVFVSYVLSEMVPHCHSTWKNEAVRRMYHIRGLHSGVGVVDSVRSYTAPGKLESCSGDAAIVFQMLPRALHCSKTVLLSTYRSGCRDPSRLSISDSELPCQSAISLGLYALTSRLQFH